MPKRKAILQRNRQEVSSEFLREYKSHGRGKRTVRCGWNKHKVFIRIDSAGARRVDDRTFRWMVREAARLAIKDRVLDITQYYSRLLARGAKKEPARTLADLAGW